MLFEDHKTYKYQRIVFTYNNFRSLINTQIMANKTNIGIGSVIILLAAAYLGLDIQQDKLQPPSSQSLAPHEQAFQQHAGDEKSNTPAASDTQNNVSIIQQAFERKQSNVQVQAGGRVKAVLQDDNEGSRHQKFILQLQNGQTVLVAHNIDLAPRIENIQKGDRVEFYGEYEYSAQGGVIHWTHHDPQQRHADGWLKHDGKIYQ